MLTSVMLLHNPINYCITLFHSPHHEQDELLADRLILTNQNLTTSCVKDNKL